MTKSSAKTHKIANIVNGMAQNEAEMKKLGKEMKSMKTNAEVVESGMVPDPAQ
jgi:hypothetical protein